MIVARAARIVLRGLIGTLAGFAAMFATAWAVTGIMDRLIDPPPCRDVMGRRVASACVDVLPVWAVVLALTISVLAGLAAAMATGWLTRGMGASVTEPLPGTSFR